MKTFTIIAKGRSSSDVKLAIAESMRLIDNGNTSGFNRNEDGSFSFDSEGEYEDDAETENNE